MRRVVVHSRGVLAVGWLVLTGCTGPKKVEPPSGDRSSYVAAFAECASASATSFKATADGLVTATAAHASAPSTKTLLDARAAFHAAMDAWQMNEVLRFGPAAASTTPGGQDLRDEIYSWPLVSRCAVEEEIVSKAYETNTAALLVNRRGLAAIEYLLFYEGADTACPSYSAIVSAGSWAALSATERDGRKRTYAAKAAEDVAARAAQLSRAWDPAGGDFKEKMLGTALFPSAQRALNVVSDGLLSHVENEVRDMKLARPLGLLDCPAGSVCPELLESSFAHRSRRNVEANLRGFRKLMYGCGPDDEGPGFEDLLRSLNQGGVADRMRQSDEQTTAALAAVAPDDFRTTLTADKAKVTAVYDGLSTLTKVLKTEFLSVLDLELPMSLEGDND